MRKASGSGGNRRSLRLYDGTMTEFID